MAWWNDWKEAWDDWVEERAKQGMENNEKNEGRKLMTYDSTVGLV